MVSQTEAAPVDPLALEASLRPFGESRMLPGECYVGADVFAWEQRHFFGGGWMCVGLGSDLADAGDQAARSTGASGVLLTRDRELRLRAFANTCRHRGHELLPCGAKARRDIVVCPYHGWSYRLNGDLRKAAGYDSGQLAGFRPEEHGLVELPCEEWHGYVFVDASREAAPLRTHLAGLEEIVAPYEPERLVVTARHDYDVAANWKVLTENYHECYHCPMIHPQLCEISPHDSGENYAHTGSGAWAGGWMELRDSAETMSVGGGAVAPPLRGLDERRRRIVDYVAIFPNVLVSLHPDYVMTHLLTPRSADRTHVECLWAFAPEALEAGCDTAPAVEFWDVTNGQDWRACESVQRGLASPHSVPGVLSRAEDGVYQFVTMVARGYAGLPVAPGALAAS